MVFISEYLEIFLGPGLDNQTVETFVMEVDYGIFHIDDLSVYTPNGTPLEKLTMKHVVHGGKHDIQLSNWVLCRIRYDTPVV
jgi:hypothetical protein